MEIADLLSKNNEPDWANALKRLTLEFDADPVVGRGRVLALYGGMGSFNDIVLYDKQGQPLQVENDELSGLRTELHAACRSTSG